MLNWMLMPSIQGNIIVSVRGYMCAQGRVMVVLSVGVVLSLLTPPFSDKGGSLLRRRHISNTQH